MQPPHADIVVAGHICLDIIPYISARKQGIEDVFVPGKLIDVGQAITCTGGAVSNTGLALHRLGIATRLMGKIGKDAFGQTILDVLHQYEEQLAQSMIVSPSESSSYTIVISPEGVDRVFLHHTGANDSFISSDLKMDVIQRAKIFHFGYPPLMKQMYRDHGKQLSQLFAQVKATGVLTSLDLAKPDPDSEAGQVDWTKILAHTLPHVDVFMPSYEEILYMLDRPKYEALVHQHGSSNLLSHIEASVLSELSHTLIDMGAAIVGIKLGDQGLYLHVSPTIQRLSSIHLLHSQSESIAGKQWLVPCFDVKVVGTTGAGDCTIAGFLVGLLHQFPIEESMITAVAVGACNVEQSDAVSGIPNLTHLQSRMKQGWEQRDCNVSLPHWTWNDHYKLYEGPNN